MWPKITATMGAAIIALLTFIRIRSKKIDRLERNDAVHEKLDDIREVEKIEFVEVLKKEEAKVNESIEKNKSSSRRDRAKRL